MSERSDGNCRFALATWIYLAHASGHPADDAELTAACQAVADAEDAATGDAAGQVLIDRVSAMVTTTDGAGVGALLRTLYGDVVTSDLGAGSREDRLKQVRSYQFQRGIPWLARVFERHADGTVGPEWLVIERVTDQVVAMDPNPWDDIPEERTLPTSDFMVLWELDACTSFALA